MGAAARRGLRSTYVHADLFVNPTNPRMGAAGGER